jgi:hypothetical protein
LQRFVSIASGQGNFAALRLVSCAGKVSLEGLRGDGRASDLLSGSGKSELYKPYDVPQEFDVAFVGQCYGDRPAYIKYLLDEGIDVRVWAMAGASVSPRRKPTTPLRVRCKEPQMSDESC